MFTLVFRLWRRHPLTARLLCLLLVPGLALGWLLVPHVMEARAAAASEISLQGASGPIRIRRDALGVPAISARSEADAYFATGYMHARDRMWQMELQRRLAYGRLSEVMGARALERDRWMRTLGLGQAARASWKALGPPAQGALRAYAAGVNAYLASGARLGPEFAALGVRPQPWEPVDSLAWMKVFSLMLSGGMNRELSRFLAAQTLTRAQMDTFFVPEPTAPGSAPAAAVNVLESLAQAQLALENTAGIGGRFVGSNAWVVGAKLTGGQGALLANDPHLPLQMPSFWYALAQDGGELHAAGMSLVGVPLVVFGHNRHIAWAGTSLPADTQDLYFEQIDPARPGQYGADGAWRSFTVRRERIGVRADFPASLHAPLRPVELDVRSSWHGPVISDAIGFGQQPVALRWVALDPDDTTFEAVQRLSYARNWDEFGAALSRFVSPTLNMLYADRRGNIGYLGVGRVPVRSHGQGSLPQPVGPGRTKWLRYLAWDAMPRLYNPAAGYLVSANDDLLGSQYPHFLSLDFAAPDRAHRIAQMLEERARVRPLGVADFKQMQADVLSLPARRLVALLAATRPQAGAQRESVALLTGWDGKMALDSAPASLFNVWTQKLSRRLFVERPGMEGTRRGYVEQRFLKGMLEQAQVNELVRALSDTRAPWCANGGRFADSSCAQLMLAALDEARETLVKTAGAQPREWAWGRLHYAEFGHQPFGSVNLLRQLFNRAEASGGSPDTVNVASFETDSAGYYRQSFGASFRHIVRMQASQTEYWMMNSTGQSGNVFSPHYADMSALFAQHQYRRLDAATAPDTP